MISRGRGGGPKERREGAHPSIRTECTRLSENASASLEGVTWSGGWSDIVGKPSPCTDTCYDRRKTFLLVSKRFLSDGAP